MTIDKRINYRGGSRYRGRSSGPGPGGQGARGQATQNPGRAPRATPVQNVHQTGAVTQTPGRPTYQNVHQTGAVTQTPGRPVQQLGTANQVSTAVTTGGQSPFVHTRPQGITNIDRVKRMISSARNVPWSNFNPLNLLFGSAAQAKPYSTEDMMKLLGITDQATAEKYVEDPYTARPRFIEREKRTDPRTQAEAMSKFHENLLKQEKNTNKTFEQQRQAALELGIRPTDRGLIPSDYLIKPGEAAEQASYSDMAEEIAKKYGLARGGVVGLFKYGGFLG